MGNKLFGINVSGLINQHVGPGVLLGVLRKFPKSSTQKSSVLAPPPLADPVPHNFRGFVETFDIDTDTVNGTPIQEDDRQIIIIGDSLPAGVVPVKNDEICLLYTYPSPRDRG